MKVRPSSYLNQVEIGDGTSLLFNGHSLCIDLVPTDFARELSEGGDLSFLLPEEKQHLLNRGHLTALSAAREAGELKKLVGQVLQKRARADKKRRIANLCFILTYKCNLSCKYCYQKSIPDTADIPPMSAAFVDSFFSRSLPELFPWRPKRLYLTLFGGEPLLPSNRETIARILAHASRRPSIRLSVTTNATTLPAMADLIGEGKGKIPHVQVTLDGDRMHHNENRIPASGAPTFDTVIGSVRKLIELKAKISLRMHVHDGKLESARALVDYLEKEKILGNPQVSAYFSPINTFDGDINAQSDPGTFGQLFQQVSSRTSRPPSNLDYMYKFIDMQEKKILPKVRFCGAGSDGFYVVDPLADIYSCYEEAGHKDRRVGTFSRGRVKFFPLKKQYSRRNLLSLPECIKCSMALFCAGGCPSEARVRKGSIFEPYCHQNKTFIAQTLKAFYLKRQANPLQ